MTTYAKVFPRTAPLHTDFAREFVSRRVGLAVTTHLYQRLPAYKRGPRKGLVKGEVHWRKCESGGWYADPDDFGRRGVIYKGASPIKVILDGVGTLLDESALTCTTDADRIKWINEVVGNQKETER